MDSKSVGVQDAQFVVLPLPAPLDPCVRNATYPHGLEMPSKFCQNAPFPVMFIKNSTDLVGPNTPGWI